MEQAAVGSAPAMEGEAPPAPSTTQAAPGGGWGGGGGAGASEGSSSPIYVSYEEKREPSDRKPSRKSSGHTYTPKFFLVDRHGREYLAATGEDQGDAHYLYENQSNFPFLRANNKSDVRSWLEGIIARSKERAGVESHLVMDAVPQDPRQIHLPKFVGHSQEKLELADGRHRIEWFLLDENNDTHLAVVGEEKETRDGHYLYRTHGVFDKALPLQAGNQREVERWLNDMVFHGGVAPPGPSGKAPGDSVGGAPTTSGRGHSALVSDTSTHRGASSRGAQVARPGGQKGGQKHDLLKQATSNAKKQKTALSGRLAPDPDQEARDVVATEMTRWAQEEAQRREAAKRQALAYATDPLGGKEAAMAKRCMGVLNQAAGQASFLPPPPQAPGGSPRSSGSGAGSHQQQLNLVDTLAALRELGHTYAPLSLVAMPELKECLGQLQSHKHPQVSQLAASVLEQWLRTAVAQAQVLTDPRYVQDPRSVLEASLSDRTIMDPIVSALTHRKLHPPQQQQHGQGQHTRTGSRLGTSTGAVPTAGGAALGTGGGGGEDTAATPGGLSTRASEQSLQDLVMAGPDTAADSAGDAPAGGLAHQTVERRRLNLDGLESPAAAALTTAVAQHQQQHLTVSSSGLGAGGAGLAGGPFNSSGVGHLRGLPPSDSLSALQENGSADDDGNVGYATSVDLIDAPVQDLESEQAEMIS